VVKWQVIFAVGEKKRNGRPTSRHMYLALRPFIVHFLIIPDMRLFFLALVVGIAVMFAAVGCQKEVFTTDGGDKLSFSVDTLRIDTVFVESGSATRFFKAYNSSSKSIRISKIALRDGADSKFRINVDGLPGRSFENIEIAPQDSLYIFVEVTIDPDAPLSVSPFVVQEALDFETNGNQQVVILEAWGQNANYIPSRFYADSLVSLGCNGGEWIWDDPRPYVIYGGVFIDECTVRMPPGTRVHIHGGLSRFTDDSTSFLYNDGILAFTGNGRLLIEGTKDQPVVIQSDRLEAEFSETGGQYAGIWLQSGTKGHRIEHAIIKHGITGVRVDSAAELTIKKSTIYHTTGSGLVGVHATIIAENCLIYDNGTYGIQTEYGGDYRFDYCTVGAYGSGGESIKLSNALCLDQLCQDALYYRLVARMRNCVFVGDRNDQVTLFDRFDEPGDFDYRFTNCLVRTKDLTRPDSYPDFYTNCDPCINIKQTDTVFIDPRDFNFRLDTMHSKANGYGAPIFGILDDQDHKPRDTQMPDSGCFEIEF
jgi:Right handed beta helix region